MTTATATILASASTPFCEEKRIALEDGILTYTMAECVATEEGEYWQEYEYSMADAPAALKAEALRNLRNLPEWSPSLELELR